MPVISAHALLGIGGLMLWVLYLVGDQKRLALATIALGASLASSLGWAQTSQGSGMGQVIQNVLNQPGGLLSHSRFTRHASRITFYVSRQNKLSPFAGGVHL